MVKVKLDLETIRAENLQYIRNEKQRKDQSKNNIGINSAKNSLSFGVE
jgi:hypothetical protein